MTTNREETDLYEILGCDELSSQEQIIAEYKIRAKALHPDKIPERVDRDATEKFITYVIFYLSFLKCFLVN